MRKPKKHLLTKTPKICHGRYAHFGSRESPKTREMTSSKKGLCLSKLAAQTQSLVFQKYHSYDVVTISGVACNIEYIL